MSAFLSSLKVFANRGTTLGNAHLRATYPSAGGMEPSNQRRPPLYREVMPRKEEYWPTANDNNSKTETNK